MEVPAAFFQLDGPGAVSEETVLAMAEGAISNSRASVGVAVSGVAGPDGGTEEKPVGTVWIACRWEDKVITQRFLFTGDRRAVRLATLEAALVCLLNLVT